MQFIFVVLSTIGMCQLDCHGAPKAPLLLIEDMGAIMHEEHACAFVASADLQAMSSLSMLTLVEHWLRLRLVDNWFH